LRVIVLETLEGLSRVEGVAQGAAYFFENGFHENAETVIV
jgi:hypothetical protein